MPEHAPSPTPSRAVYGFAMFLSFKTFFILYLIWALIPEEWFRMVGVTCLPQRYWAVTIPIFLLTILAVFAFFIYPNLGLCMTPDVHEMKTFQDKTENIKSFPQKQKVGACICVNKETCSKDQYLRNCGDFVVRAIPVLEVLNIESVSEQLYGK